MSGRGATLDVSLSIGVFAVIATILLLLARGCDAAANSLGQYDVLMSLVWVVHIRRVR